MDERTRRWERFPRPETGDPLQMLRTMIVAVRSAPRDPEARRRLRALAAEQGSWDQLVPLLADEARAAERPDVAAAFFEELADVYENLDQPLETITAMEAVVAHEPDDAEHHDRLAWLYRRAGAWSKAAEAFERVAELEPGERARAALRGAGALYREHNKLDRAAGIYRRIIELRPSDADAWRALDDVLTELGRWREVADVRGHRAERARGVDRAALLRSKARALEQAGDTPAAAGVVAEALHHAPEDLSGLVDYADVLARSGQGREAADIIGKRIAEALARRPAPRDSASAIATGRIEALADRASTGRIDVRRDSTDRTALVDELGEPTGRSELVAPPPSEAPPSERPDAISTNTDEVAALRLRLAGILDESCNDRAAALAVLEQLLDEVPDYMPALERVTAFAARDPDPRIHAAALLRYANALPGTERPPIVIAAARRFREAHDRRAALRAFEDACELAPDDDDLREELEDARAAVVVERTAAEPDRETAERRLRAVLATRPHHVDANLALVELLIAARRLEEAAEHLRETLASVPDDEPPEVAPLVHRYAGVVALLGDSDEAHRLLHEAHRIDRRDLGITLALGESCFTRRLWREAARHLGSLADHPDASRRAPEVARGLVHAALAEVRALRPANAAAHYEAAVRIDPRCAPAWHALAEQAIERGELARAAEHLEREANWTTEPRDRVRLFDALGDMALDVLGDPAHAERCWRQLLDAGNAAVLDKLLALQRKRGAVERAETCERLAALLPPRAKELYEEAADAYVAGGDLARAREIADRLIADHPRDLDAVTCATAITIALGDARRTAMWLRRVLTGADAEQEGQDPRRADLWRRLGDAERSLGNGDAARQAYRRAVIAAPESDGALGARRGLVELADPGTTTSPHALQSSLFALVEVEHDPADALALARQLMREDAESARATLELARVLGGVLDETDVEFLAAHAARRLAPDEGYAERADRTLVDDEADAPLGDVLEIVAEAAPLLLPDAKTAMFDAGFPDARRLPATSDAAVTAMFPQIAKLLGGPPALLFAVSDPKIELALLLASPAVIVIGPRVEAMRDLDAAGDAALRFRIGRLVELARPRRLFTAGADFARLVAAVASFAGPGEPDERLRAKLSVAQRKQLADRLAECGPLDAAAYDLACERAADRAGLLACGDIGVAVEIAGGLPRARHLVQLAATKRYLEARRRLRTRDVEERTSPFTKP